MGRWGAARELGAHVCGTRLVARSPAEQRADVGDVEEVGVHAGRDQQQRRDDHRGNGGDRALPPPVAQVDPHHGGNECHRQRGEDRRGGEWQVHEGLRARIY